MKAVVYEGPHQVAVQTVPDVRIENPTDAIVKVTSTAICGSDLHMYDGCSAAQPGTSLGHEIMGVVDAVGPGVQSIKQGDRVVMPFNIACGFCFNCVRGYPNACLTTNPQGVGAGYGYVGLGPHRGGQAEYVRVPFADYNCLKLPGRPGDQLEDDFVLLADIFPTAYHANELAGVQTGSTVAVYGAGPVGLLSAYSALLRGASEVYVVDAIPARLQLVQKMGATPVDASKGDPCQQILDLRRSNRGQGHSLPPGEAKMPGVLCGIDAVGYEAIDYWGTRERQPNVVIEQLVRLVNPTGQIGVIGAYFPQDPCGRTPEQKQGALQLHFGEMWRKGIAVGTGQTPVARYNRFLRDLIIDGRAKPSMIVSHRLPLQAAPDAYEKFCERADGYTKVVLKPEMAAAA